MPSDALKMVADMIRENLGDGVPSVEDLRAQASAGDGAYPIPEGVDFEAAVADGVPVEWVVPEGALDAAALVHCHGGGYAVGGITGSRQFGARLAIAAQARVLLVDYRLAPEHTFPAAVDDLKTAYRWLLGQEVPPSRTVLVGESSGGGLTLATLLALRDDGDPMPRMAVCMSPWTDMELTGETVTTKADEDPLVKVGMLTMLADTYLAGEDKRNPYASPLYGDPSGLPPLYFQTGTAEILLDDTLRFADKAKSAGVEVTLDVWDDMIHTWQLFAAYVPEGQEAIDKIGSAVRDALSEG